MTSQSFRAIDLLRAIVATIAVSLALSACGSSGPTPQLLGARRVYDNARTSSAVSLAPDKLAAARVALDAAEKAHKEDPGSYREAHLAYIAARRAEIAMVQGQTVAAMRAERGYQAQLDRSTKEEQLADAKSELQSAREARQEAEARAAAALDRLKEVANVEQNTRGTVITLSGAVLFQTASDKLSDNAKVSLDKVADALENQAPEAEIHIEGYTDATGTEQYNEALSQRRATAVRTYLLDKGVNAGHLDAVGRGESSPVASNDTADGRAYNRRVEIIIGSQKTALPKELGTEPNKPPAPASSAKGAKDDKDMDDMNPKDDKSTDDKDMDDMNPKDDTNAPSP